MARAEWPKPPGRAASVRLPLANGSPLSRGPRREGNLEARSSRVNAGVTRAVDKAGDDLGTSVRIVVDARGTTWGWRAEARPEIALTCGYVADRLWIENCWEKVWNGVP